MNTSGRPSEWALRFFRWYCHPSVKDSIEGDLMELYSERLNVNGKRNARWRFFWDVVLLCRPGIIRPATGLHQLNQYDMFKNYFTVGIRNLLKYKIFSFINVFGLALAMSVCMLVILILADQGRYESFQQNKDRMYRILSGYTASRNDYATSPLPLGSAMVDGIPFVEKTTTLEPGPGGEGMWHDHLAEMRGYFADPAFFEVFSFALEKGNRTSALKLPNAMVISSDIAEKLFGDVNPIGNIIEFSDRQLPFPQDYGGIASKPVPWGSFTVTGVIDESKYKTHLKFDVLISNASLPRLYAEKKFPDRTNDWEFFYRCYTFALIRADKTAVDLNEALAALAKMQYANVKNEELKGFNFTAQKMTDIQRDVKGNDTNNRLPKIGYYFLFILALVIIVSASLNYTNLSIARALTRAKEIGVRKVTGAFRRDLVYQFLSESVVTTLLSMALGVGMLFAIKPAFKGLWVNKFLDFELPDSGSTYFYFFGFAIVVGLAAGFYPALYLSRYQPIKALKNLENKRKRGFGIRKVLSVSQFVISLFFITTSILIFRQFEYFLEFDYGFKAKNVVNVELQGADYRKVATLFSTVPGVEIVSATDIIPATGTNNGIQLKKTGSTAEYENAGILLTDENFTRVLDIHLVAGKELPPAGDSTGNFILVNQAMVKKLGYQHPSEIVGQILESKWGKEQLVVAGVVEDFRYNLLINRNVIDPLVLRSVPVRFAYSNIRIGSADLIATVRQLEDKWKLIDPIHAFKHEFFDAQLAATHQGIFDLVSILGFIALLAITIACLGLLGMASYTAERRKKEVGIRKVLGAEEFTIVMLLSWEFLRILLIAIAIASPLSYFVNNLWLQHLPSRIEFGYQTVLLGIGVLLVPGLITIVTQTLRAARANPAESLKVE